jgi:hypothetical protein
MYVVCRERWNVSPGCNSERVKERKEVKRRNRRCSEEEGRRCLYIINFGLDHNCVNQAQIRLMACTPPLLTIAPMFTFQPFFLLFLLCLFKDWPRAQHTRNREAAQEKNMANPPVSAA